MKTLKFLIGILLLTSLMASCSKEQTNNSLLTSTFNSNGAFILPGENNGGNVTCEEVATYTGCTFDYSSGRIDYYGGTGGTTGPIRWHTNGTEVWWETIDGSQIKVAIIVKGGPNANVYSYCEECKSGSGSVKLTAPINPKNGKPYGLSNITFCYSLCPPPDKVLAFKSYMNLNPFKADDNWVVTGGGPANNYFIGHVPFTTGVVYPLYLGGDLSHQGGTLVVGNFDADLLLEVKVTSTIPDLKFTEPFLYVGSLAGFNTDHRNYPYPMPRLYFDPGVTEVIINLPF
jgi:hypothetical protein